jgi:hypothetical protein
MLSKRIYTMKALQDELHIYSARLWYQDGNTFVYKGKTGDMPVKLAVHALANKTYIVDMYVGKECGCGS